MNGHPCLSSRTMKSSDKSRSSCFSDFMLEYVTSNLLSKNILPVLSSSIWKLIVVPVYVFPVLSDITVISLITCAYTSVTSI